jgi:hypothetical protein
MADPILGNRYCTQKIWEKHGIKQAGFWTVLIGDGNHDLHCLLPSDSLADCEKKNGMRFRPIRRGTKRAMTAKRTDRRLRI